MGSFFSAHRPLLNHHAGPALCPCLFFAAGLSGGISGPPPAPCNCDDGGSGRPSILQSVAEAAKESSDHFLVSVQIDEEVAKLLQLKAQLGGEDGKHQFVLKTPKVGALLDPPVLSVLTEQQASATRRS